MLVKGPEYDEYLIFETETIRYDPDLYEFSWNARGNLEGYSKDRHVHCFTWQPHGSQFTIIEEIPRDRLHVKVRVPEKLEKEQVLKALNFNKSWIVKVEDTLDE